MTLTIAISSLVLTAGVALVAVGTGVAAAMWRAGVGGRAGRVLDALALLALMMPPFLAVNAWLEVTIRMRAASATGWLPLVDLGLAVLVLAGIYWPISYFLVGAAWRLTPAAWIEADPELRGSHLISNVLWPATRGTVGLSCGLIAFLAAANFTVPVLFQVRVWSEEIWIRFNSQLDAWGALRAGWPVLLGAVILAWLLPKTLVARTESSRSIAPAVFRRRLGAIGPVAAAVTSVMLVAGFVFPLFRLVRSERTWTELGDAFRAGAGVFRFTAVLSVIVAIIVVTLAVVLVSRREVSRRAMGLGLLGFVVPGVVLSMGYIHLFNRPLFRWWYPGAGMMAFALVVHFIGPALMAMATARSRANPVWLDAARSVGAAGWSLWSLAIWPQLLPTACRVGCLVLLLALWEIESLVLILPPGGETVAVRIFNLLHYGHAGQVNALCLMLMLMAIVLVAAGAGVASLVKRSGSLRNPGLAGLAALALVGCTDRPEVASKREVGGELFDSVEIWGARGNAPGQFNKPRSLVCDREGCLYVTDMTGRVQKFDGTGRFVRQWRMPETVLGKPKGAGLDRDGNVLILEPHYQRVNHFSTDGALVCQWGARGTNDGEFLLPRAIAQNSKGEFVIPEYLVRERVQVFSPNVVRPGTTNASSSTPTQSVVRVWGSPGKSTGSFNRAEGICVDAQDRIHVADSCNHRIQTFLADGSFVETFGQSGDLPGELSYPYDVKVDTAGYRFICEFGNSRVTVLDASNRVVEILGKPGGEPGEFANPWSIALDREGNLYVADSMNHRVQKWHRRRDRGGAGVLAAADRAKQNSEGGP